MSETVANVFEIFRKPKNVFNKMFEFFEFQPMLTHNRYEIFNPSKITNRKNQREYNGYTHDSEVQLKSDLIIIIQEINNDCFYQNDYHPVIKHGC